MIIGIGALVLASFFAAAALYISLVEHPARMVLADEPLLAQWQPSYKRALPLQASLAVLGGGCGLVAWFVSGYWQWLMGGLALLANWPFTFFAIMPVNSCLLAIGPESASPESRALLMRWGRLHHARSILGTVAMLHFTAALAFA